MKLQASFRSASRPVTTAWLRKLSALVLKDVKGAAFEKKAELSIVLTGDGEVRKLNRLYRKKDRTTDVLSFPQLEGWGPGPGSGKVIALGDVVISLPQARRQALERKKPFQKELALLLVHGILHLLGHDHVTLAQEKRMFKLQDRLLKKLGLL